MDFWRIPISDLVEEDLPPVSKASAVDFVAEPGPAGLLSKIRVQPLGGGGGLEAAGCRGDVATPPRTDTDQPASVAKAPGHFGGWRGQKSKGWVDIPVDIPKRPEAVEETQEHRELLQAEQTRMLARDALRAARTAEDLRSAISQARAAGLSSEVKVAERNLSKMQS
eukprot:TRINITY_DN16327_c0_g1_i1.p2 TRINITY_DN16327_c0_g1~~TRINITY_DN16327_c0_g1_i1.p2  ORF type:complete len:167 (-),score=26.90 TRINITY_DN16327_c0_g1_i1:106-606(-)